MIWLAKIVKWLLGTGFGNAFLAAIVGLVALLVNNSYQRSIGADRVITGSIEQGKAINEKNARVRERAKEPGAFERLLRNSCRDCD